MKQPTASAYPISDFLEWEKGQNLVIAPKFQRRDIWIAKAKSYLIDSILRGMPIPPIFIRLRTDPELMKTIREVVDGQQRLRAVLGFVRDEFAILGMHNADLAGKYFSRLPKAVQKQFLSYKFLVNHLEEISDAEVLEIFARMNTYTVKLNAQELRNAEFFGAFKEVAYKLAYAHNTFWVGNDIINDQQVARMKDAELSSILMVTMLDGIRQTKDNDLREFYRKYEDDFPLEKKIYREFEWVIDIIGQMLRESLKNTPFRRIPLFYSIFIAIYDAKYGLPKSNKPRLKIDSRWIRDVGPIFMQLADELQALEPNKKYEAFIRASKYSTADIGTRKIRHEFIWNHVLKSGK